MVVDLLKNGKKEGWWVGVLVLLFWSSVSTPAGYSLAFAQLPTSSSIVGGHVSEEDLPPEESPPPAPSPAVISPLPAPPTAKKAGELVPVPPVVQQPAASVPAAPVLPENTVLTPRELAALRFVEAGKSLLDQADFDRAREQFERAVALAPLQPYGYYFLGRVAFARRQHKQAVAFLRKAELLFAPSDRAWIGETTSLQGAVYEDLGDYTQARAAYQRCLQVAPANLKALSALARLPEQEPSLGDTIQH